MEWPDGSLPSQQLGLQLRVLPGALLGQEQRPWLRWTEPDGKLLLHDSERADAEKERADAEKERAAAEAERARELQERLAAYEKKFGTL